MSYESPQMPIPEILASFRESSINVNENDFVRPDPRRWRDIYSQMFEILTSKSIEQVIQSLFRIEKTQTDYHDLYEEGFAQISFTLCLKRVLCSCGFDSFSVKDVIEPTPKRVQRISSVFLNKSRHDQLRRVFFQETNDRIQKSRGQFEDVLRKNEELKQKLKEDSLIQQQREAETQRAQEELEQVQQRVVDLDRQQELERRGMEELKVKVAETDNEKENLKQMKSAVLQEAEKMSHKIVQSPTRFKQEQERYKRKVTEMKSELGKKEQVLSENRTLLEQTMNESSTSEKAVKLVKEVQGDLEKENEIEGDIQVLKESCNELEEALSSLFIQEEDLTEQLKLRQEQKHKLAGQKDRREQSTAQEISDLRQYYDEVAGNIKKITSETSQIQSKVLRVKDEVTAIEGAWEEDQKDSKKELLQLIDEMKMVNQNIFEGHAHFKENVLVD